MQCPNCNKEVKESKDPQKKYCSKKCKLLSHQKRVRERRKSGLNSRYKFKCLFCKKDFFGYDLKQKYCSLECAQNARKKYLNIPDCLENSHRKIDKNIGYVRIYAPMHKEANTWGYVYEHRLIAENKINRELLPNEIVHHKNGLRWDNRLENLEIMTKYEHGKIKTTA